MIRALSHVALRVTDLDRSLAFYTDVIGLKEAFRLTREDGRPWLVYVEVAPMQFIELFPGAEGPREELKNSGLVHICLEVEDIQAAARELQSRGAEIVRGPSLGGDGSWQFWVRDPDGNQIEFHQFGAESRQVTG